jgi:hypothetical protein
MAQVVSKFQTMYVTTYLDNFDRDSLFRSVGLGDGLNYAPESYGSALLRQKSTLGVAAPCFRVPIGLHQDQRGEKTHVSSNATKASSRSDFTLQCPETRSLTVHREPKWVSESP